MLAARDNGFSEQKVTRLEILVTEQEAMLEQYSDLIRDQQEQIARLADKIEMIELKLSRYQETVGEDPGDEVPPHY